MCDCLTWEEHLSRCGPAAATFDGVGSAPAVLPLALDPGPAQIVPLRRRAWYSQEPSQLERAS